MEESPKSHFSFIKFIRFFFDSVFHPRHDNSIIAQGARQIINGICATSADLGVFQGFVSIGLHPMLAALISFGVAATTNFFLTRYYVIGEVKIQKKPIFLQYITYVFSAICSLAIAQLFILIFHFGLGLAPFLAKLISVPVIFVFTLTLGRYVIFNKYS
ncbi:MAG: GtrA family protein [Deltaproteobacteria bacterium]|jgi:putative flippase GtrA|nr:GtrA family protein [Deltaproteobacteria bacterium]